MSSDSSRTDEADPIRNQPRRRSASAPARAAFSTPRWPTSTSATGEAGRLPARQPDFCLFVAEYHSPRHGAHGRCLAPDLVGMGRSGKMPNGGYRFADHAALPRRLVRRARFHVATCVLVAHDWGSALGFHRARRATRTRLRAISVHGKLIVSPMSFERFQLLGAKIFQAIRSARRARQMILDENLFVEGISRAV